MTRMTVGPPVWCQCQDRDTQNRQLANPLPEAKSKIRMNSWSLWYLSTWGQFVTPGTRKVVYPADRHPRNVLNDQDTYLFDWAAPCLRPSPRHPECLGQTAVWFSSLLPKASSGCLAAGWPGCSSPDAKYGMPGTNYWSKQQPNSRGQVWDKKLVEQAAQGQGQGWDTLERWVIDLAARC